MASVWWNWFGPGPRNWTLPVLLELILRNRLTLITISFWKCPFLMWKISETLCRAHSFNMVTLGSPIGNQSIFLKRPWRNTKWSYRFLLSVSCLPILESTYPFAYFSEFLFPMQTNPFVVAVVFNILSLNVLLSLMQLQTAFPVNIFLLTLLNPLKVVFVLIISWFLLGWDLIHTLNSTMLSISFI